MRSLPPRRRAPGGRKLGSALAGALLLGTLLAACAGELNTPVEALRLLASDLPEAVIDEPYSAQLHVTGGLRPYSFTLEEGRLPAGLSLANGFVSGTPTQLGDATFTVRVADANLSQFTADFRLRVVEVPPTTLVLRPPETEVRSAVTLRARVGEARSLLGLRTVVSWDPEAFRLREDSLVANRRGLALFSSAAPGTLQVDLAQLAGEGPGGSGAIDGSADLFSFVLEPLDAPALVAVAATTEFVSAGSDGHRLELAESLEGAPAARATLIRLLGDGATAAAPAASTDDPGPPEPAPEADPEAPEPGPAPEDETGGDGP